MINVIQLSTFHRWPLAVSTLSSLNVVLHTVVHAAVPTTLLRLLLQRVHTIWPANRASNNSCIIRIASEIGNCSLRLYTCLNSGCAVSFCMFPMLRLKNISHMIEIAATILIRVDIFIFQEFNNFKKCNCEEGTQQWAYPIYPRGAWKVCKHNVKSEVSLINFAQKLISIK